MDSKWAISSRGHQNSTIFGFWALISPVMKITSADIVTLFVVQLSPMKKTYLNYWKPHVTPPIRSQWHEFNWSYEIKHYIINNVTSTYLHQWSHLHCQPVVYYRAMYLFHSTLLRNQVDLWSEEVCSDPGVGHSLASNTCMHEALCHTRWMMSL